MLILKLNIFLTGEAMKFHATPSTLLISIFIALVFVSVSVFIVSELNILSPTLIATNYLLDEIALIDSDINISFSSIERNLRDRFLIHNLLVRYKGKELLYFETITIKKGLFGVIQYALTGNGTLGIVADDGMLNLDSVFSNMEKTEKSNPSKPLDLTAILEKEIEVKLPDSLSKFGFDIELKGFDVLLPGGIHTEISDLGLYWDHGIDNFQLNTTIDTFTMLIADTNLTMNNFACSINNSTGLTASLAVENVALYSKDILADIDNFNLSAYINNLERFKLDDIPFNISFDKISADIYKNIISLGRTEFSSIGTEAFFNVYDVAAQYNSYDASLDSLKISTPDLDEFDINLSNVSLNDNNNDFISLAELNTNAVISDESLSLELKGLNAKQLGRYTGDFLTEAYLPNIMLTAKANDGIFGFEISTSPEFAISERLLDGLSFTTSFSGKIRKGEDKISFGEKSITLPISVEHLNFDLNDISTNEFSTPLSFDVYYDRSGLVAKFTDTESIHGSITLTDSFNILFESNGYNLSRLDGFIAEYIPIISRYISEETKLTAQIRSELEFDENSFLGVTGLFNYSFNLDDISFNDNHFSIGSDMKSRILEEKLDVTYFDIDSSYFDFTSVFSIPFNQMLPEGTFSFLSSDRSESYLSGELILSDIREYTYFGTTPKVRDTSISGVVNFNTDNIIKSNALLSLLGTKYDLFLNIDLAKSLLTLVNDNLDIVVDWSDILVLTMDLDNFPLSTETPELVPGYVNGNVDFRFDFAKQLFTLEIHEFILSHINHLPDNPDIGFSVSANNDCIDVKEIFIRSDNYPELSGKSYTDFKEKSFALFISDSEAKEVFLISVINTDGSYLSTVRGDTINLSRFGLEGLQSNFILTGSAAKLQDFSFIGILEAKGMEEESDGRKITANIFIDDSYLNLTDVVYSNNSLSVDIPSVSFDSKKGLLDIKNAGAEFVITQKDGPFTLSAEFSAGVNIFPGNTIIDSIVESVSNGFNGLSINGELHEASISEYISAYDKAFYGIYNDKIFDFDSEMITGYFNTVDNTVDITVDVDPVAAFRLAGGFDIDGRFDVNLDLRKLDVSILNYVFTLPVLEFDAGGYLEGNINISSGERGLDIFGRFGAEYAEFDTFWLPNQKILLHNVEFEIWDNDIETVLCNSSVLNLDTMERSKVDIRVGLRFDEGFGFESWDIDVYLDEDNMIPFRLPMTASNIDITGKVGGHYRIDATTSLVESTGDVFVKDVILSFGMQDSLPEWWGTTIENSIALDINMMNNIQFIFPYGSNPILRAVIADNTKISFSLTPKDGMKASGDIPLRSGEIFYFQKYFYITEGNIRLGETVEGGLNPIINLRARIRDFDSAGNKVDIYLNLKEATLNNIKPSFDSSPAKDQNEIMSILGQSIIPVDNLNTAGTGMQSVVTMAAASVDMLSNLGVFGSFGKALDSSIRQGLTLDTFSLHTNMLSNIINDTARLTGITSATTALSPIARYLDGTTLYLGKYLSPEVYLSAMFHLSARRNEDRSSFAFLSDDLILDTELSIEWISPIATITFFSKPSNLTLYEFVDKFGFSLTKRIVF